jgi:uncharacterized protein YndB with AHSA1/START domain
MSFKPTTHSAFTLERKLDAPPALVFQAFSTKEGKQRWFVAHAAKEKIRAMDFRVGGEEKLAGEWPNGLLDQLVTSFNPKH